MRKQGPRFVIAILLLVLALLSGCGGAKAPPTAPLTGAPTATVAATVGGPRAASATAAPRADVPAKAYDTLRYVETHDGKPPPGYAGGTVFENRERRLPPGRYTEYDVDPRGRGGRNAERLVIERDSGRAYYTGDHYDTFIPLSDGR